MLQKGDTIGLIACSNGRSPEQEKDIAHVEKLLFTHFGVKTERAATIFKKENDLANGTPEERAKALMKMYQNTEIAAIFDISGGDIANEILPYLDFERIKVVQKSFIGYSDLTVIQNAIYAKSGVRGYNYQLMNLGGEASAQQLELFQSIFMTTHKRSISHEVLLSKADIHGEVIGGNIRCLLKLAGTEYMPDPKGKVILLEALSGDVAKIRTYIAQLEQIGLFKEANGVILGQFTEMQEKNLVPTIETLMQPYLKKYDKFLLKTNLVGHQQDAEPFPIGFPIEDFIN